MKRNKDKRIFAKILIRYIICTVVFSIPLWVFGDRYLLLIEDVTGSESFYDIGTVIPTVFSLYFDFFDGFIQAYVFVFLTSLFIAEATETE